MHWNKHKKITPTVGIEPTTIGLKGQRSTFWARWANVTPNTSSENRTRDLRGVARCHNQLDQARLWCNSGQNKCILEKANENFTNLVSQLIGSTKNWQTWQKRTKKIANPGFDPGTFGLWAQRASAAPIRCDMMMINRLLFIAALVSVGYDVALTRRRSRVRLPEAVFQNVVIGSVAERSKALV